MLLKRTGYMAVDSTPEITPAVVPTAQESVSPCTTRTARAVPPTMAAMNAMIRTGVFGRGVVCPTLRRGQRAPSQESCATVAVGTLLGR